MRTVSEGESNHHGSGCGTSKIDEPRKPERKGERAHGHEELEWRQKCEESTGKKFKRKQVSKILR